MAIADTSSLDIAFSKLYGTVPLTPEIIKHTLDGYIPLVNLDYICSIKDKDGKIYEVGASYESKDNVRLEVLCTNKNKYGYPFIEKVEVKKTRAKKIEE